MSYRLTSEVVLERPLDEVFEFFADASNLEAITPPELHFRILTPLPMEMEKGRLIQYRLSLYKVPFRWLTEIAVWEPGVCFVDQQLRGPFSKWVHTHNFEALSDHRTRIYDEVEYALPLAPIGNLAHPLVRAKLDRIFSYREQRVAELLAPSGGAS